MQNKENNQQRNNQHKKQSTKKQSTKKTIIKETKTDQELMEAKTNQTTMNFIRQ